MPSQELPDSDWAAEVMYNTRVSTRVSEVIFPLTGALVSVRDEFDHASSLEPRKPSGAFLESPYFFFPLVCKAVELDDHLRGPV